MKVGHRLAELLLENGVDYVYGVPGGQTLPLYEGISKFQGRIQHVLMRDERSAGYAADAYARLTGKTGVCDATVGPGATNLTSPLAEAYCSSIPLIAIISDISRAWEHRRHRGNASQAMNQMEMFGPVSKWQVTVTDPRSLDNVIDTAFRVATSGKPGPVVVCIPDDVASSDFEFRTPVVGREGAKYPQVRTTPDPTDVARAARLLEAAAKPVLVVGGGAHISGCYDQVRSVAELLGCPIVTTISGMGVIEREHPLAFGTTGSFGSPVARDINQAADLVMFVGCKAGQLTTFSYKCPDKNTQVIHLDIDPEEIGRNFPNTAPLLGDAKLGLNALLAELKKPKPTVTWDLKAYAKQYEQWYAEKTDPKHTANEPLRPPAVMAILNEHLTNEDMVVCDASLSSGWAAAYLQFKGAGRRCIAPRGLAGLGWGSPATVGAALALDKNQRVLQLTGDGGFGYSVAELEVMLRLKLPVVTILLNNDTLGWIKHVQKDHYDQNYVSTDFAHVDFATVAKGFGARSYTVRTLEEFRQCLVKEASPDGPALIEVISDQWSTPVLALK
jgi:acetolactate synthase-1/2/3 large subunit